MAQIIVMSYPGLCPGLVCYIISGLKNAIKSSNEIKRNFVLRLHVNINKGGQIQLQPLVFVLFVDEVNNL